MRQHCRTQHGYDPNPNVTNKRSTGAVIAHEVSEGIKKRLQTKINESLSLRELAIGRPIRSEVLKSITSTDSAIDYLLDNHILLQKRQVQGISGHICRNCLTFHFKYIVDIGRDITPTENHRCLPSAVAYAKSLRDRYAAEFHLIADSVKLISQQCKFIFGSPVELAVHSISRETMKSTNFHSPCINLFTIDSSHWAWSAIRKRRLIIEAENLSKLIYNMIGTFVVFSISSGEMQGNYLIKLIRQKHLK